jgi:hypothetical protein
MLLAIILICLAVALGLGGLLIEGAKILLIVAVVLLIAGAISGYRGRRQL